MEGGATSGPSCGSFLGSKPCGSSREALPGPAVLAPFAEMKGRSAERLRGCKLSTSPLDIFTWQVKAISNHFISFHFISSF